MAELWFKFNNFRRIWKRRIWKKNLWPHIKILGTVTSSNKWWYWVNGGKNNIKWILKLNHFKNNCYNSLNHQLPVWLMGKRELGVLIKGR